MPEIFLSLRLINWKDIGAALFIGFVLAVCFYACW